MSEQPERLVLEYLSRVGEAAYGVLPARRRAAFLREVRARVEDACDRADARTEAEVRRVLGAMGTPERVVAAEEDAAEAQAAESEEEPSGVRDGAGGPADASAVEAEEDADTSAANIFRTRHPPPWRGGPNYGWLGSRAGQGETIMVRQGREAAAASGARVAETARWRRGGGVQGLAGAVRAMAAHPAEASAFLLYGACAAIGAALVLWPVAAVLVGLSAVWSRSDKWVLVGVPLASTVMGMAFWQGDAPFIDQMILDSLLATGVIGLRIALAACAVYMLTRIDTAVQAWGQRKTSADGVTRR